MKRPPFYILSSDPRYDRLAALCEERGFSVSRSPKDAQGQKAVFVFSLGEKNAFILSVLFHALPGSVALVGKADEVLSSFARENGIRLIRALEDPAYLKQNALSTAEGALSRVIESTDRRLSELCLLIYGYGVCGSEIARLFWLCGCDVWVWSRERGNKKAIEDGFNLYCAPTLGLGMFDGVINTVPDPVFPPSLLSTLRPGAHFFQVASGASGISPSFLQERGVLYHDLHGLPGKFAPASEADALFLLIQKALKGQNRKE